MCARISHANFKIVLFIFFILTPALASSAELLSGGLNKKLGEKYLFDDVLKVTESSEAFIVTYDYTPPLPVLTEFHVMLTPLSYRIYGILASDQFGDKQECAGWMSTLSTTVVNKYYDQSAGDKIYIYDEHEGMKLEKKNNGRWIKINCTGSQLNMTYGDPEIENIKNKEFFRLRRLKDLFSNGRYAEISAELHELSSQDVLQAHVLLGIMYRAGNGVEKNSSKAEQYYVKGAKRKYPTALYNLGTFLMNEGRLAEAQNWLTTAANMGIRNAQYNLGQLHSNLQKPPNYREAFKWFKESAELGHLEGQYNTCHMYSAGDGVPRNEVQAYMWCEIAARSGHRIAAENRDHISQRMSEEEIAQARKLADNWYAQHP